MQTKFVSDFSGVHGVLQENISGYLFPRYRPTHRKILLVGKDQEQSIPQLVFVEHTLQFLTCLDDTISVIRVDHEDDALSILEVMPPQRSNLVLPTNIPYCELNVLVFDSLNVEACGEGSICMESWSGSIHTDGGNCSPIQCQHMRKDVSTGLRQKVVVHTQSHQA